MTKMENLNVVLNSKHQFSSNVKFGHFWCELDNYTTEHYFAIVSSVKVLGMQIWASLHVVKHMWPPRMVIPVILGTSNENRQGSI